MAITGTKSYYYQRKIADLALGQQAYTPPTGIFLALLLSAIDFSATGGWPGEVTALGYLRFSAVNGLAAGQWTTALTASGSAYKFNAADWNFPTAQGLWGNVQYFQILDAAAAGNMLYFGELATAKAVASGDVFRFPSGAIMVTET